jgi:AcrR family transcriptional regulator
MDESEIRQRILDAAVWCVERNGLGNVTIDDIVNECGLSRATVYRRYRNREALLTELVRCYIEPYEEKGKQILSGPESFADRIQALFVWCITGMSRSHWLKEMFRNGVSSENLSLYGSLYKERAMTFLGPFVREAHDSGELRAELSCDELVEWFMREVPFYVATGLTDRRQLIKKYDLFLRPVLEPAPAASFSGGGMERRVSQLEEAIGSIQAMLTRIARNTSGQKRN